MTKYIKFLYIFGLIIILVAGFGIFAATQMNNTSDKINNTPKNSEASENSEKPLTAKDEVQETNQEKNSSREEATQASQPAEEISTDTQQKTSKNYQTYTNEYYPNLEIKYPADFSLQEKTKPSVFNNLVIRELIFENNEGNFVIALSPQERVNCELPLENTAFYENKFGEQVRDGVLFVEKNTPCSKLEESKIRTNLPLATSPDYAAVYTPSGQKEIRYDFGLSTNTPNEQIKEAIRETLLNSNLE